MTEFQAKVNGMVIAGASGDHAESSIRFYAALYRDEGEVTIQQKINGRWRIVEKLSHVEAVVKCRP